MNEVLYFEINKNKSFFIIDMDMETYVPEEHIIQSENDQGLNIYIFNCFYEILYYRNK